MTAALMAARGNMQESPARNPRAKLGLPKPAYVMSGTAQLQLRPVPIMPTMDSGPYSFCIRRTFSSMMSSASSQLMRSHLFSPRSPARLRGYFRRSGWLTASTMFRQRMHSVPLL